MLLSAHFSILERKFKYDKKLQGCSPLRRFSAISSMQPVNTTNQRHGDTFGWTRLTQGLLNADITRGSQELQELNRTWTITRLLRISTKQQNLTSAHFIKITDQGTRKHWKQRITDAPLQATLSWPNWWRKAIYSAMKTRWAIDDWMEKIIHNEKNRKDMKRICIWWPGFGLLSSSVLSYYVLMTSTSLRSPNAPHSVFIATWEAEPGIFPKFSTLLAAST